jgi:hypothetical protein
MVPGRRMEGPMTILDRARGKRLRIDPGQFADELAKRLPDLDQVDLGKAREAAGSAISDAAEALRESLEGAGDKARSVRADVEKAADRAASDTPLDDLGQRLRGLTAGGGLRSLVSRLERELPDTDKDRYERAYERGRVQARSMFLVVGAAVGIAAGVLGAIFLDPQRGKARREEVARRLSAIGRNAKEQAAGKARFAQDRARGMAIERGIVQPEGDGSREPALSGEATRRDPVPVMDPQAAPNWPASEGPVEQPLDRVEFGAHEALPEDAAGSAGGAETGEPADTAPRA